MDDEKPVIETMTAAMPSASQAPIAAKPAVKKKKKKAAKKAPPKKAKKSKR